MMQDSVGKGLKNEWFHKTCSFGFLMWVSRSLWSNLTSHVFTETFGSCSIAGTSHQRKVYPACSCRKAGKFHFFASLMVHPSTASLMEENHNFPCHLAGTRNTFDYITWSGRHQNGITTRIGTCALIGWDHYSHFP